MAVASYTVRAESFVACHLYRTERMKKQVANSVAERELEKVPAAIEKKSNDHGTSARFEKAGRPWRNDLRGIPEQLQTIGHA